MRLKISGRNLRYSWVDVATRLQFSEGKWRPAFEVIELMSSMKQLAAQVLGSDEATRIHALTPASFADADRLLADPWEGQTHEALANAKRRGGQPAAARGRWPDLTICRDFGFGTIRAVLHRRLASQGRVLLCISEIPSIVRTAHRVVLAGVDAVLVQSDALARAVHAFGVPASRIVLPANCNDLALFDRPARARAGSDLHRFIHVGDLEPEAGVADFLLCVAAWAERNPRGRVGIQWCGEGCLRGVLEAQPLPPNVQQWFPGRISRKELAAAFLDCDVLAVPALADPWGDAVMEALTAQLPVLGSTQSQAVVDWVVHGKTGWVFNPFDPGAMARAVELALSTPPDELDRMRTCAAERSKPSQPSLSQRIWRAMRLEGVGPELDPALLRLAF